MPKLQNTRKRPVSALPTNASKRRRCCSNAQEEHASSVAHLAALKKFVEKRGALPKRHSKGKLEERLSQWLMQLGRWYRAGKHQELFKQLRSVRFMKSRIAQWQRKPQKKFDVRLKQLEKWVRQHGRLPIRKAASAGERSIATFLSHIQAMRTKLPQALLERIKQMAPALRDRVESWHDFSTLDKRLAELAKFTRKHKRVPKRRAAGAAERSLGSFISRLQQLRNDLSKAQLKALKEMSPLIRARVDSWRESEHKPTKQRLKDLQQFIRRSGRLPLRAGDNPEDRSLTIFLGHLQQLYCHRQLASEHWRFLRSMPLMRERTNRWQELRARKEQAVADARRRQPVAAARRLAQPPQSKGLGKAKAKAKAADPKAKPKPAPKDVRAAAAFLRRAKKLAAPPPEEGAETLQQQEPEGETARRRIRRKALPPSPGPDRGPTRSQGAREESQMEENETENAELEKGKGVTVNIELEKACHDAIKEREAAKLSKSKKGAQQEEEEEEEEEEEQEQDDDEAIMSCWSEEEESRGTAEGASISPDVVTEENEEADEEDEEEEDEQEEEAAAEAEAQDKVVGNLSSAVPNKDLSSVATHLIGDETGAEVAEGRAAGQSHLELQKSAIEVTVALCNDQPEVHADDHYDSGIGCLASSKDKVRRRCDHDKVTFKMPISVEVLVKPVKDNELFVSPTEVHNNQKCTNCGFRFTSRRRHQIDRGDEHVDLICNKCFDIAPALRAKFAQKRAEREKERELRGLARRSDGRRSRAHRG